MIKSTEERINTANKPGLETFGMGTRTQQPELITQAGQATMAVHKGKAAHKELKVGWVVVVSGCVCREGGGERGRRRKGLQQLAGGTPLLTAAVPAQAPGLAVLHVWMHLPCPSPPAPSSPPMLFLTIGATLCSSPQERLKKLDQELAAERTARHRAEHEMLQLSIKAERAAAERAEGNVAHLKAVLGGKH